MLPTSALHPAPDDLPLPRQTRAFIVLVALLQGGLLYLAEWGADHGVAPFAALGGRVCWYTLVLTVPSMLLLSVQTLHDRRLWQQLAVVAAVFAALAGWAAWSATGAPGLESNKVLTPFGLSVAAALLIALPWLQFRQHHGSWRASYHALFEHAWQNTLTLALALVFIGVCWGVLTLWAELFALVKIDLFRTLFREDAFIYLATGTMAGLGILIGRTRQRAVQVMRQIVFALCTGLVPLLASIALLFILTLPLTGLQPLWQTRAAAAILLCMVFGLVLFTNAVYQDGATRRRIPAGCGALSRPGYSHCRSMQAWPFTRWACALPSTAGPANASGAWCWPRWPAPMQWDTPLQCCGHARGSGWRRWRAATRCCRGWSSPCCYWSIRLCWIRIGLWWPASCSSWHSAAALQTRTCCRTIWNSCGLPTAAVVITRCKRCGTPPSLPTMPGAAGSSLCCSRGRNVGRNRSRMTHCDARACTTWPSCRHTCCSLQAAAARTQPGGAPWRRAACTTTAACNAMRTA